MEKTTEKLNRTVVFDAKNSARSKDENGYMKVTGCNLTKEQVVPYLGMELPNSEELGLIPDKKYYMYRPAKELQNAVKSFDGVPLEYEHHETDAQNLPKQFYIGCVGTEGTFDSPYLKNTLVFHDAKAIEEIENGEVIELSASYYFDPVMEGGIFNGEHYDGVMTNIRGNHVALVRRGRAGPDVRVADSAAITNPPAGEIQKAEGEKIKEGETKMDKEATKVKETQDVDGQQKLPFDNPDIVQKDANPQPPAAAQGEEGDPGTQAVDAELQALKDAMTKCGIDAENEELRKAFAAGTKWGEEKEKEESEKQEIDPEKCECDKQCGDVCGEKQTIDACEVEKIKDEAVQAAVQAAQDSFKKLITAAHDCESILGVISTDKLLTMDADKVYAKALEAKGIKTDGVDASAYPALVGMAKANDAQMREMQTKINDSAANKEDTTLNRIIENAKKTQYEN